MSTRWWAPVRPSLTPDAVVLALLTSGGDAGGDLGSAVLAAHRAGAGACEAVAKAGLVSKASLIEALASTRAMLADSMVTSISKSMDPCYAGLLVADVFDDAEACALSLYGTAISKGVSPPVAASRVGAVFGVPSSALGKYQSLACDPKANPAALVDAADRSLMGYVSKLVASESDHQVAKAEQPRDADGRWATTGGVFPTDPEIIEQYSSTDCWKIAYEIHKRTGWPIISLDDSESEGDPAGSGWWFHVVVQRPDGMLVDVNGAHTPEQVADHWDGWGSWDFEPLDGSTDKWMGTAYNPKDIDEETHKIVDGILGKGPVAKADAFDPREHPRADNGQFATASAPSELPPEPPPEQSQTGLGDPSILARLRSMFGGGGQAAPEVAPEPQARQTRAARQTRQTRQQRAPVQARATQRVARSATKLTQAQAQMIARVTQAKNERVLEPATADLPNLLIDPDPKTKNANYFYPLSYPLVFTVDAKSDNDFHQKLRMQSNKQHDPSAAIFKMGHLLNQADNPQIEVASQNKAAIDQGNARARAAKAEAENVGYVEPGVRFIRPSDRPPGSGNQSIREVEDWFESERMSEFSSSVVRPSGLVVEDVDWAEDAFTRLLPEYMPLGKDVNESDYASMVVVHYKPADASKPSIRPMPAISEYVIEGDAIGTEEDWGNSKKQLSFTLDHNTAYKVVVPPGEIPWSKPAPITMWDDKRGVLVRRYYLRAIADAEVEDIVHGDVNKADFAEAAHPRGQDGRWTESAPQELPPEEAPVARESTPERRQERQTRQTRQTRQVRQSRQEAPAQARQQASVVARSTRGASMHPLAQAIHARFAAQRDHDIEGFLPPLSDSSNYRVFTEHNQWDEARGSYVPGFNDVTDTISADAFTSMIGGQKIKLNSVTRALILTAKDHRVESLSETMRYNTEVDLAAKAGAEIISRPIGSMPTGLMQDKEAITNKVVSLFAANKGLDQVEMVRKDQTLFFYGNSVPASPQILLQLDIGTNPDAPMVMQYVGRKRAHDVRVLLGDQMPRSLVNVGDFTSDATVTNPEMQIFKITNPVVDRYSVKNG